MCSPTHIRLVIPATDSGVLTKALREVLATLGGERGPADQYILPWSQDARLGVAVVPGQGFVRLELLHHPASNIGQAGKDDVLRELLAATAARQGGPNDVNDPVSRLLANGRGVAFTVRPSAIARRLLLDTSRKIAQALANVEPRMRVPIKSMAVSEWLAGYLVATAGEPEIAEIAAAVSFDQGAEAVTLARLTPGAQKQMASLFNEKVTLVATVPSALATLSLVLPRPAGLADVEPLFSPAFDMKSLRDLSDTVAEAGTPAWLALLARPMGLLRLLSQDRQVTAELEKPTTWPSAVAFELHDFDDDHLSFRARGRLPRNDAGAASWISLAKRIADEMGNGATDVREEAASDATWVTWQQNLAQGTASDGPRELAKDAAGTFAAARLSFRGIADRLAHRNGEPRGKSDRDLMQLFHLLAECEIRQRWQDGWLIGETRIGATDASRMLPFEPDLPRAIHNPNERVSAMSRRSLEQAALKARMALRALANVDPSMRKQLLHLGRAEITNALAEAKRDPETMAEAQALDSLFLNIGRDFERGAADSISAP